MKSFVSKRALQWGALLTGALLVAVPARAYVLYTVPTDSEVPLRWFSDNSVIFFDLNEPEEIAPTAAHDVVMTSFRQWSNLSCDGELSDYSFESGGYVQGRDIGYLSDPGAPNENLVKWVTKSSEWLHGEEVVALTSLTYDTYNGQIVDADIEINDARYVFSASGDPKSSEMDLQNAVTHEAGHFLGLDHSTRKLATMFAKAQPGEVLKADLNSDDIDGFCALYGPNAVPYPPARSTGTAPVCTASDTVPTELPVGTALVLLLTFAALARVRRASRASSAGR